MRRVMTPESGVCRIDPRVWSSGAGLGRIGSSQFSQNLQIGSGRVKFLQMQLFFMEEGKFG